MENENARSYFQVIDKPWRTEFDKLLNNAQNFLEEKESVWMKTFTERVNADFTNSFDIMMRISPQYLNKMQNAYLFMQSGAMLDLDVIPKIQQPHKSTGSKQQKAAEVLKMDGIRCQNWDDVIIEFLDGNTIKIQCGNFKTRLNYSEIGFMDRRSGVPTKAWLLFEEIAQKGGVIGPGKHRNRTIPKAVVGNKEYENEGYSITTFPLSDERKKQKQILSEKLQDIFGVKSDPFHPYIKGIGWKAKFKISYR